MTVDEIMEAADRLDPDSRVELAWRLWESMRAYPEAAPWEHADLKEVESDPREVLPQLVARVRTARSGFDIRHRGVVEDADAGT